MLLWFFLNILNGIHILSGKKCFNDTKIVLKNKKSCTTGYGPRTIFYLILISFFYLLIRARPIELEKERILYFHIEFYSSGSVRALRFPAAACGLCVLSSIFLPFSDHAMQQIVNSSANLPLYICKNVNIEKNFLSVDLSEILVEINKSISLLTITSSHTAQ
jgi:hypothetical protein